MELFLQDDVLYITKDGVTIKLDGCDIRSINELYDKEVYFRQDVVNNIENYVHDGELPLSALENEKYINVVLDRYNQLRVDNDGVADGKSWIECLDEAFDSVEYSE